LSDGLDIGNQKQRIRRAFNINDSGVFTDGIFDISRFVGYKSVLDVKFAKLSCGKRGRFANVSEHIADNMSIFDLCSQPSFICSLQISLSRRVVE
jgi:hypothetical protein